MRVFQIYKLFNPVTTDVRYIGITCQSLDRRLTYHMRPDNPNEELAAWIRSLQKQDVLPCISALETFHGTRAQAETKERAWIWHYLEQGADLLNSNHLPGNKAMFRDFLRGQYLELFVSSLRQYHAERRYSFNQRADASISVWGSLHADAM